MFGSKRWQPAAALAGGLVVFVALAGCRTFEGAAPQGGDPTDHAGHPSPSSGEMSPAVAATSQAVSPGQPAKTLSPDPLDAPAPTSVLEAQRSAEMAEGDHGGHGTGTYRQVDAGRGPRAYEGSEPQPPGAEPHQHDPAPPASGHEGHSQEAAVYACPMHPEVTSNAPGKCSKCGMVLVERRKE